MEGRLWTTSVHPGVTADYEEDEMFAALLAPTKNLGRRRRVISRHKLLVEWREAEVWQKADAVTVDVNNSGCMAVVGSDLKVGQPVRLTNASTGSTAYAMVVWRNHEAWEAGMKFAKPKPGFWGLNISEEREGLFGRKAEPKAVPEGRSKTREK
jgi:hypothetical protein